MGTLGTPGAGGGQGRPRGGDTGHLLGLGARTPPGWGYWDPPGLGTLGTPPGLGTGTPGTPGACGGRTGPPLAWGHQEPPGAGRGNRATPRDRATGAGGQGHPPGLGPPGTSRGWEGGQSHPPGLGTPGPPGTGGGLDTPGTPQALRSSAILGQAGPGAGPSPRAILG
ncbi:PREDICTED: collagen alpha-1(III) chain-like [Nipponia nippon]|uniref:collagen alpha-1(III) chain-like n=1 Tax=Nipponia nippon TaxID=128390 RepID=UPI000510CB47|nr:PREDICTED: collagen alpha-1(III) chain-like [Nipponia nippon]